jgi:hypothetical protein
MRIGFTILGLIALLAGLVWIGQGTGIFPYPRSSFMIDQMRWAWYGAALAIAGLLLLAYARRF